ncbi:hypothetical protein OJF2_78090 [Aquisphaera giovannonii]|uniref:Uncharacterized protein n=1 Tax=Aquisphaera giovannonii TaxID=406548 RepID=A0A5B9WF76_9BACT|nr:hypothetical protein [Aquisphaera giovannonii]QEH39197.1 hypothetical protein OJF2_78090 [Aquisphaera giovannonii]
MTEPKDLVLINDELRRANRRWKLVALTSLAALVLVALFGVMRAEQHRRRAEAELRRALAMAAEAERAARQARNP